ncbi:tRNA (adenosine(37)-N6)-threonylcarbamoyltransferase complex dimerization subunit type 1 TsaB [Candidatus Atribacteria bacterium RBG_19FT_COMBO_35_14]|uniref:tRNA (Adenosine(37)-N6)-threonylcarbamoyltransferase complex dimerization subunit type 1 TsaB n=1 Tax=Candidatus Sediminicultor quintus TaxID=1797291 RepID=A0A1F5AB06_9BACT|nr:MAG: tRNA (adenosine(37)-N6)-threonylcarbamoyltransferase complex dimerization subunit type 1 TsaB [Candidatus Atribacteria bacterium RBG_19FT_COMBO_35_14]OGD31623.1 MAG: tRNA (adenosine(37)-N6)-threonylcarbamoyltransferase complex dimerization subunit type 1 TsaB [Candidatus Atribacteria bacterium RBG_16_35_8]
MKILGIDTSAKFCNLGLIEDEDILIEYTINGLRKKHSSILVPAIKNLLKTIDLKIEEINGIAVSMGPGSFTGLRIGLCVAKGLCYARSLPLLGIPTLDAMAFPFKEIPYLICPVLESKKDEIYDVVFRGGVSLHRVMDYKCEDIQSLLARLSPLKEKIIFSGDGIKKYRDIIKNKIGKNALFIDSQLNFPVAASIAFLGLNKLKKGEEDNVSTLSPFYLRKSEAEIIWEKKYK